MKANYFDMYESMQRGEESLDGHPVHAGTKMAALHAKDLRRRRAAAKAEEMRKRAEGLVWPNTPFLVRREVKSRGVVKVKEKKREEKEKEERQQQGKKEKDEKQQQQEKTEQLQTKGQTKKPKEKHEQPKAAKVVRVKNEKKTQGQPTITTAAPPIPTPPSKATGKKRGPYKKREKKPQDDKAPKRVVSKNGMVSLAASAQASQVLVEAAQRKREEQGSKEGEGQGGGGRGEKEGGGAANTVDSPMQRS